MSQKGAPSSTIFLSFHRYYCLCIASSLAQKVYYAYNICCEFCVPWETSHAAKHVFVPILARGSVQGTGLKPLLQSLVGNGGCVQKSLKGSSFVVRRPLETQEENNSSQLFSRWFATSYFCSETFNRTFGQVRFLVNKLVEVRRKYLSISLCTDVLLELINTVKSINSEMTVPS